MRNVLKFLFPCLFIICLIYGMNNAGEYSNNQDIKRIEDTTERLCLKCYSIEGKYPDDIQELKEYGLRYDEEEYNLIYHKEGDNILPTIKVYRKEKHYE